jgi:response regulator RpfG family c-di-GMP phosphodiesterase
MKHPVAVPDNPDNNGLHHLLIVDDEPIVLASLRETLGREGYRVTAAANAVEALAHLRERAYSVVITDQRMPGLTGLEFLSQVRERQPDATRILITAVLSLGVVIDAINKGEIYRFIVKPWLREELLVTVSNAVQRFDLICRNATLQATLLATNEKLVEANARLAEQAARRAEQNQHLESLRHALEENLQHSVELCLKTMETFYPTLGNQARRVHELCRAMAEGLSLEPSQRHSLEIGAYLHDIGLVGVPRQVIRQWESSPGSLTEAERALVRQHPILGQELVGFGHHLEEVGDIIRAHHEHFDGSGYPDGRRGDQIPWLARILSVAVAYAESRRDSESTVEAIKQLRGQVFDPEAVRVFLRCLPQAMVPRRQREVLLAELQPGMIVAQGIYNASGLLLVSDGQRLTETSIDKLNNHNRINPISHALVVYS